MSSTADLALVVATLGVGFAGYVYAWKWLDEVSTEIVTGVARTSALPLPTRWRRHLLRTRWPYLMISIVGWAAFIAAATIKVADLATDPGVKAVAYFAAGIGALVSIGSLAHGGLEFLELRSIVRDSNDDSK